MSVNSKMTAIADAIRAKTGGTDTLTLDQMAQNIAAIDTSENLDTVLAQQETLIADIKTALEGKAAASVEWGWFSSVHRSNYSEYYKFPFLIGMTWAEWLSTPCNMVVAIDYQASTQEGGAMYASGDYVRYEHPSFSGELYISTDGTEAGRVVLTDEIVSETTYNYYYVSTGAPEPF